MSPPATDPEQSIRDAVAAGQVEEAVSVALRAYGGEILTFIGSRLRSQSDADEAFSMFAEDLWLGLPKFSFRCAVRTWAYAIARNAAIRYATAPQRRAARNVALSSPDCLPRLVDAVRSTTHVYQRTDVKDRFRALREQLEPEDQSLLVLRVDRGLSWNDLAFAMAGDVNLDDDAVKRESARLRKAFERVKTELRRLAERDGLLDPDA
jgi:RNA polymerase sigma-70 factor (ECF subfamily)